MDPAGYQGEHGRQRDDFGNGPAGDTPRLAADFDMIALAAMCVTLVLAWAAVALIGGLMALTARRIAAAVADARRRLRVRHELSPDWWPRFEADLRAYASTEWTAARRAERHAGPAR